jgi:chromosomal replication initiator protein
MPPMRSAGIWKPPQIMHADRRIRQQMAERRSLYNQIAELTNRIKQTA